MCGDGTGIDFRWQEAVIPRLEADFPLCYRHIHLCLGPNS
jgi:hypothetical protein